MVQGLVRKPREINQNFLLMCDFLLLKTADYDACLVYACEQFTVFLLSFKNLVFHINSSLTTLMSLH